MKLLSIIFLSILTFAAVAQDPPAAKAPNAASEFVFKVDKVSGKIDLFQGANTQAVTAKYAVSRMEVDIFDAKGQYTGTLELKDFLIPTSEVEVYEKLKISAVVLKDTATGELIRLNNVAIVEHAKKQ